jgi:segregation and condensation protein B
MKKFNVDQLEMEEASKKHLYMSIIESLLFASGEPLKLKEISAILECSDDQTESLIEEMKRRYKSEERGLKLITVNNSYQLVTKPENSEYVEKLLKVNNRQSLSQAALETLAIIAYKQPITRVSIDEIRGVKSDRAVITLLDKGLIKETGRLEVAGRPILYSTTDKFLLQFGLESLNEMPSLEELFSLGGEVEEEGLISPKEIETKE